MARQAGGFGTPMAVEGAKELASLIRKIGDRDLKKALRDAHKTVAELVKDRAKRIVPSRSGKLRKSIGARAGQRDSKVKAGSKARVPYAGVIEFGWAARGIKAQPFMRRALSDKYRDGDLVKTYEKEIGGVLRRIEGRL